MDRVDEDRQHGLGGAGIVELQRFAMRVRFECVTRELLDHCGIEAALERVLDNGAAELRRAAVRRRSGRRRTFTGGPADDAEIGAGIHGKLRQHVRREVLVLIVADNHQGVRVHVREPAANFCKAAANRRETSLDLGICFVCDLRPFGRHAAVLDRVVVPRARRAPRIPRGGIDERIGVCREHRADDGAHQALAALGKEDMIFPFAAGARF